MSENHEIYDITVIGGGPAGLFAAFYAGTHGVSVKIIESLSELDGQPAILYPEKAIYDMAGFPEITAAELTENLVKQLERFENQTTICLKEEVKTFEKEGDVFTIEINRGQHFSRATVIVCGNDAFAPRTLGLEGEEEYADNSPFCNVHKLDQFASKDIVTCGGGDSTVDWANHLDGLAKSVTIVHRRDAFRIHEHSAEVLKQSNVKIMTPYVPVTLDGNGQFANCLTIQKVKSDETAELPLDALVVSSDSSTSNKNFKSWNVDHKRSSTMVSPLSETSQEGVYAIGDAADYEDKVALIASGFGGAPTAINQAIKYIYLDRDNHVVYSTSLIKDKEK